jgi:hypothetical protein
MYRRGTLDDVAEKHDVISLHHSLEHIPDQIATMKKVAACLSDDGTALVRIPVFPNALWELYGDCWHGLDVPRHLYLHSERSIAIVAESAGMQVVKSFCDMGEFHFIASELYRAGLSFSGQRDYQHHHEAGITQAQIDRWKAQAATLNAAGTGAEATFVLKHQ